MDAIVAFLRENIYSLWPIRVVDKGNQGIRWHSNGTVTLLHPGWHLFWPRIERIDEYSVEYQNTDTGIQGLTTSDGETVSLSMNVGYSISDVSILYTKFQNFDASLINKARGFLAEAVPYRTWKDIYSDPSAVAQEVLERLQEDLGEEDGPVLIEDVTLDQAVKARAYRLFSNASMY